MDTKDVVIAAYLFPDLAQQDFDAVLKLAEDKQLTVEGVVVVQKDADGKVTSSRPATISAARRQDRRRGRARRRPARAAAAGITAVGAAAGALIGKFAKHRVESGIARSSMPHCPLAPEA